MSVSLAYEKCGQTGAVKEGPPLRSLGAVDTMRPAPKFSGTVDCSESSEGDCDVPEIASKKADSAHGRPIGIKKAKMHGSGPDSSLSSSAISSLSSAVTEVSVKKSELNFKCINALPDSEEKTKLLLDLLKSFDPMPSTE